MAKASGNKARAKRIRDLMAAAEIAAPQLATQLDVATSTVYHWCTGRCFPSRDLQPKVARHLHCTVAELNGWPT